MVAPDTHERLYSSEISTSVIQLAGTTPPSPRVNEGPTVEFWQWYDHPAVAKTKSAGAGVNGVTNEGVVLVVG